MKNRCLMPLIIMCISLLSISNAVYPVDGVAVSVKGHSWYIYGAVDGQLWRHDIVNSVVVKHTLLDSGPCTHPCISPDGKKVAFVRNTTPGDTCPSGNCNGDNWFNTEGGSICVMDIDGAPNSRTQLVICEKSTAALDFPSNTWIYYNGGVNDQSGTRDLRRVSITGTMESVVWTKWSTTQFGISNDLSRAVFRTSDNGGTDPNDPLLNQPRNTIIGYDMITGAGWQYHSLAGNTNPSCGAGISSDGLYAHDGWIDHDGFDIRNWSNGTIVKSVSNATALKWPPNTRDFGNNTSHEALSSSGATNSPKWRCVSINNHQVLINWVDQQCIVATGDVTGLGWPTNVFDAGDFWVDMADTVPIKIEKPYNGQIFKVGDTMTIRWVINPARFSGAMIVGISANSGISYNTISTEAINRTSSAYFNADTGTFKWVVTKAVIKPDNSEISNISDSCIIRVSAPYDNPIRYGFSKGRFVINDSGAVNTPIFTPPAGTYHVATNATVSCATTGAVVRYTIGQKSVVTLEVYTVLGRKVATLVDGIMDAGTYAVSIDNRIRNGRALGAGFYFVKLSAGKNQIVNQLAVVN